MKALKTILIVLSFWGVLVEARNWEKVEIPDAVCGNGQPYSVFLNRKQADRLLVEFMSGGACWSEGTCYGSSPLASLQPPSMPETSVVAEEGAGNPWSYHTALYFPYCTGDVHAGMHVTSYKPQLPLYHQGYRNVAKALEYLHQQNILSFHNMKDVTVWGASAGAIGALVHSRTIESYLNSTAHKTLIADSPGLHFGKSFWRKFSADLNRDYQLNFAKIDLWYSLDDGFLAPHMGPVFMKLSEWDVGILQSTKDMVMSIVFGNISPEAHRALVLGPQGIPVVAKMYPNVRVWIADTATHTFLLRSQTASYRDIKGEPAWSFVVRVYGM
ncbi:MAG: pectinacetylesterase family protein [Bdellovibrio sp.]|nr:pectinacetylesterase family protein [Bdellovibrio sp.]